MTAELSRRSFLSASALIGGGALAGLAVGSGVLATPAVGAGGPIKPSRSFLFSGKNHSLRQDLKPRDNTTPQSFGFDRTTGLLYIAAITGSRKGSPGPGKNAEQGNITISQLDVKTGKLLGSMDLQGCGHAFSIAVVPGHHGAAPEIWFEFGSKNGYGTRLSFHRFTRTDPTVWKPIKASTLARNARRPTPAGALHVTPAFDPVYGRMAVRYVVGGKPYIDVYDVADLRNGGHYTRLAHQSLASKPLQARGGQGFAVLGNYVYLLSGSQVHNDCGSSYKPEVHGKVLGSTISRVNLTTGKLYGPTALDAFPTKGRREPNGLAIQVVSGRPRLCFGFDGYLTGASEVSKAPYKKCYSRPTPSGEPGYAQRYNIGYKDNLTRTQD